MEDSSNGPDRFERGLEVLLVQMATLAEAQTRLTEAQTAQTVRSNDHEEAILDLEAEHRRLLTAQVVTADNLQQASAKLIEIEAKLNTLIEVVDDFIRRQPKQ